MLMEESRLRWMGIDLRSRARRRVAVVATYAAFLVAVWGHAARTDAVISTIFVMECFDWAWDRFEESFPQWGRRVLMGLGVLLAGLLIADGTPIYGNVPPLRLLFAIGLLRSWSVLGGGKLVEAGGRGWLAETIAGVERGELPGRRRQRRLARCGFAIGRDGFAWHEYGAWFRQLDEAQRREVEALIAAHPRGRWMKVRKVALFDDERMRHEDDHARALVQRWLSWGLTVLAYAGFALIYCNGSISREQAVALVCTLAGLASTLRQAVVLWTEDDPRGLTNEISVVHGVEA